MRSVLRSAAVVLLGLSVSVAGVLASPARTKSKTKKPAAQKAKALRAENRATPPAAVPAAPKASAAAPAPAPAKKSSSSVYALSTAARTTAPRPQGRRGADISVAPQTASRPLIPATIGTLGFFTMETADTLQKKNVGISAYVNKWSREPGDIAVVNWGWNLSFGMSDRVSVHFVWEPVRHVHVGARNQLSLNAPLGNPVFGSTIYRSLLPVAGTAPGYVEDYPFASDNGEGPGDVTLGLKYGIWSEWRGDPVSISLRSDFIIPSRTTLTDLLDDQGQTGQFNYLIGAAASKTWASTVQGAFNFSYRFTRDPRFGGVRAMTQADQVRVGAGFLLFPEKRLQFMNEYTALIFTGTSTDNTTFGARDPIDGVWGVRWYPFERVAVDLGYRYMLNLRDHGDRNGFVIKVGGIANWKRAEPPPANRAPSAACSASRSSVYAGSGEVVSVRAQASDPDNDSLNYSWAASGGRIDGSGPEVRWNSAGLGAGNYTVTARVDDGHGGTASCAVDIRVEPRPNRAPTLTCSADRPSVLPGERVRITGTASDPDGDALTYAWRTNGGRIEGTGANVAVDTSGVSAGRYTVTGRVEDARGLASDCTVALEVKSPPAPPEASLLNQCFFRTGSARVDNVCKRILDDVALRLQNDPRARSVVVGFADPKESSKLNQQRADAAKKYLAGKGIAASRVDTRAAGGQAGAGRQNRRIDVVWLPEGASY